MECGCEARNYCSHFVTRRRLPEVKYSTMDGREDIQKEAGVLTAY